MASFAAQRDGPLSKATIHAAVRSNEQAASLSALAAVKVLQADLYDGEAMEKYVVENKSTYARVVSHVAPPHYDCEAKPLYES